MRRRHRVAVRPQARRERRARAAAALGAAALLGAAAFLVRRFPRELLRPSALREALPAPAWLRVETASFPGAPEAARPLLERALAPRLGRTWWPGEAARAEAELLARLPFFEAASARRDLGARSVAFHAALRTPVARAARKGRTSGWLAESGALFEAPEGVYPPLELPSVELGDLREPALPALADFLARARRGLACAVARVAWRPQGDGWEVTAADGTVVLWGRLEYTEAKLARLREVLRDAGTRFGSSLTADLRYFEDGRILVRPATRLAAPVRH